MTTQYFFHTAPTFDLLVGNGNHLSLVHFKGTLSETIHSETTGNLVGVDFHAEYVLYFDANALSFLLHHLENH